MNKKIQKRIDENNNMIEFYKKENEFLESLKQTGITGNQDMLLGEKHLCPGVLSGENGLKDLYGRPIV